MLRGTSGTPRTTGTHGRRGAVTVASAAVVCLGAALAACGGGGTDGGYVATGAAGGAPTTSATTAPKGGVTLVPLDGDPERGDSPSGGGSSSDAAGDLPTGSVPAGTLPAPPAGTPSAGDDSGAKSARTTPASPSTTATPGRTAPAGPTGPADLSWSEPERKATDKRWCEDVALTFSNSGGTAVRSGTVTFGTHVIGALGIDWATVTSDVRLPAPIDAGAHRKKTWTVCVDAWRVPLGMHIETKDVTVRWK